MPWLTAFAARSPFAEAFRSTPAEQGAETPSVLAELTALPAEEWPHGCAVWSPTRSA